MNKSKKVSNFLVPLFSVVFAVAIAFCSCVLLLSSVGCNNRLFVSASQKTDIFIDGDDIKSNRGFVSSSGSITLDSLYYDLNSFGYIRYNTYSKFYSLDGTVNPLSFYTDGLYDIVTSNNLIYIFPSSLKIVIDENLIDSFTYYSFYSYQLDLPVTVSDFFFGLWLHLEYNSDFYDIYLLTSFESSDVHLNSSSSIFDFSNPVPYSSIIDGYIVIWDSVFTWIITSINSVLTLFYLNGELTVFGVLAVVALSIAIFFLCVHLILKFIHFRGN